MSALSSISGGGLMSTFFLGIFQIETNKSNGNCDSQGHHQYRPFSRCFPNLGIKLLEKVGIAATRAGSP
jgi:hypothetical protein